VFSSLASRQSRACTGSSPSSARRSTSPGSSSTSRAS
jgi:hypothetical protein